jgi:hypothetical protein
MKWIAPLCGISTCLALLAGLAGAAGPDGTPHAVVVPPGCVWPQMPAPTPGRPTPGQEAPGRTTPGQTAPGQTDQGQAARDLAEAGSQAAQENLAQAPEAGTEPGGSFNPAIFGDLIGVTGSRVLILPQGTTVGAVQRGQVQGVPRGQIRVLSGGVVAAVAPLPYRASFNITENESPRPIDRVYVSYDYYNNVDAVLRFPGVPSSDLHRETIGFEKTFLDRNASVGLRLPFLQLVGNKDVEDSQVGDLSIIFKYAFYNDRSTGNLLSGGMVLTAPTGQGLRIDGESTLHSTVLQPFAGYIVNFNRAFYVQGFSSLAVPTDARDVTLLFNSMAMGYWIYRSDERDRLLTGVVPVAEFHVNTPLNHRGTDHAPIGFADSVNFTGGSYFFLRRAVLGAAVGTPLTGPRPYDFEVNATLSFRF